MSRIIPVKTPSWDFTLWELVKDDVVQMSQEDIDYIAARDSWPSSRKSEYWVSEGRENNGKRVIDFISLSRNFENLDQIPVLADSIMEDIQRKSRGIQGSEILNFQNREDWLEVNWPILAKVVGAAVASVGKSEYDSWPYSGKDARVSHKFRSEMRRMSSKNSKGNYVDQKDWDAEIINYRQRNLDPTSAILRGQSHPPTCPIIEKSGRYYLNPLGVESHKKMKDINNSLGLRGKEFRDNHGKLTFMLIKKAMEKLSSGKLDDFLIEIHGICAGHIMREEALVLHKIGLHLVSNLATRKTTRGVGGMPVPDIAHSLDTGFRFGFVLKILHDAGLIDWYTVDAERVSEAIAEIKSR